MVGALVAFGFDAVPSLSANSSLTNNRFRHYADLPGEKVNLAAIEIASPTSITILATQKRTPQGRLAAILRQDLLRAEMHLGAPDGKAAMGGQLKASTKFYDSTGKLVDPRKRSDLSSFFQLLDESGRVLGKVFAKPSSTEPALEVTIPLPKKAGPVTVRNVTVDSSQGPGFEAEQNRTISLQQPVSLSVQPQHIKLSVREGRFTTKLTVKVLHDQPLPATFTAEIEGAVKGLRLLQAKSETDILEMDLEASLPGIHRGFLLIQGAATVPIEPVRIPFEVTIKKPTLGIALPETRTLKFGPILANSGNKQIGTLEVPSHDSDETTYSVDVEDLSDGSTVVPFSADRTAINPTKDKAARLVLTGEIGNVPAGQYSASIIIKSESSSSPREWRTKVLVTITESLVIQPIDFGVVEVGKVVQGSMKLKNAAEAFATIQVVKTMIEATGGEIVAGLPAKISVGTRQEKDVPISLAVSPLVESRGVHKGSLVIRRSSKQELIVPIQVTIVDLGKGPCGLLVAPTRIHVQCKPGEVQQFEVRTKFGAAAQAPAEELAAQTAAFKDATGKVIDLEVAFKWQPGPKLTRATPITIQGFMIAPDRRGLYTSTLTVRSKESGTILIPLTLEVQ